ncbi:MAG: ATP phosphoribosyltransferase [Pseudomonadota bacterium]
MTTDNLQIVLPSKGRLMEEAIGVFADGGLTVQKVGSERGYRGEIVGMPNVEVSFISASEISAYLQSGRAHIGLTGQDLIQERMSDWQQRIDILKELGFGHADVVVAVPQCWIDVATIADIDGLAQQFRDRHARWFRVATKYVNLSRQFFDQHGFADYRIVESLGATEGTPAAGTADFIVDITTTGNTLRANGLKILDDGVILASQACFVASKKAEWTPAIREAENEILQKLGI